MPMDIRTDATTMSMTTKGTNIRNPISKARLSSDIMKAGMRTGRAISSGVAGFSLPDNSIKRARSFSRTCARMNS